MTAKDSRARQESYGQSRRFAGLEDVAIRMRLKRAQALIAARQSLPGEPLQVLELGCGYWGRNLVELSRINPGAEFTGVDLVVAAEVKGITLIEGDVIAWQPTQTYDLVLSLAVIEHLLAPEAHLALIAKALKPGGLAGLTTPTPPSHAALSALGWLRIFDREEINDHKLYLTEGGLRRAAEQAGLKVLAYEQFSLGMNQWILLRKNLFLKD